jgi:hypothetical protein
MSTTALEVLALIVSGLSMIGTVAAGIYACRAIEISKAANRTAEASLRYQVLLPALFEYRSAEMLVAIRSLWDFVREHPNDVAEAFNEQRERDLQHLALLRADERLDYMRTTIDFHRRHVSQFYAFLTSVHEDGGFQRKWIYTHWSRTDLRIIPEVIVPMEKALAQAIGSPASPITLDRLRKLYEDSPG